MNHPNPQQQPRQVEIDYSRLKANAEYRKFVETFCRYGDSYTVQARPGGTWRYKEKKLNDKVITAHLEGKYWTGVRSPWYPRFAIIDIDEPYERRDVVEEIVDRIGLKEDDYIPFTSPRGRLHLVFPVVYKDRPPTTKLLQEKLADKIFPYELYPQRNRYIRLPFGRMQYPIDYDAGGMIPVADWKRKYDLFEKLSPVDLRELRGQGRIDFPDDKRMNLGNNREAEELYNYGLQSCGTRHEAQFKILTWLARRNIPQQTAVQIVRTWTRNKNNGFSTEIRKGRLRIVDDEIRRQANWIFSRMERASQYPDGTHNLDGFVVENDLLLIKEFADSYIDRKRLFRLLCYCRPRMNHKYIFIPQWRWLQFAGKYFYQSWRRELEARGLIEIDHTYAMGEFSKSIRFKQLPTRGYRIERDGRAVQDLDRAAFIMAGSDPAAWRELTGASLPQYYLQRKTAGEIT